VNSYITEEQQIETLKKYWKEYGFSIVLGIILAIVVGSGWRFYQKYKTQKSEQASLIYERVMIDLVNNQNDDAKQQANHLIQQFSGTPYAKLAALTLAKQAVNQNKLDKAIDSLHWVVNHASNRALKQIAKIRLSRIYIQQNKAEQALKTLTTINAKSYKGLVLETQGDAYLKLGQTNKARDAYQAALKATPNPEVMRPILQMKLNNLPANSQRQAAGHNNGTATT